MVRNGIKKQVTIAVVLAFIVSAILVPTGSVISLNIKGIQERGT